MESYIIGNLIKNGKKEKARTIFYRSFRKVRARYPKLTSREVLNRVFDKCGPVIIPVSTRRGRSKYVLPRPISIEKSKSLACRWVVWSARARSGYSMVNKLADEICDILDGRGFTIARCIAFQNKALSNRFLVRKPKVTNQVHIENYNPRVVNFKRKKNLYKSPKKKFTRPSSSTKSRTIRKPSLVNSGADSKSSSR